MAAVAMRESSGNPLSFNDNPKTKDLSYGLYQINLYGELGVARLKQFREQLGLKRPEDLLDADMNARAAKLIWAGDNNNLRIAWAIDLEAGGYKQRYEIHLPAAVHAALSSPESLN